MASPLAAQIAELNDAFRAGDPHIPGQRVLTAGAVELLKRTETNADKVVKLAIDFNDFTEANGPQGDQDFGQFEFLGETWFWKIDTYDKDYQMGSEGPADLTITNRVLTIMLAEEW